MDWKYDVNEIGQNYRLSDINCALGLSQLRKVKKFIEYRKKIFNTYKEKLNKYKDIVNFFEYERFNKSSFHLFLISINFKKIRKTKNKFMKFMRDNNIICQFHYIPIYKFKNYNKKNSNFENAEYYFRNTVSLPIYYNLKAKQQNYIIKKIDNFLNQKT